ncbi:MAG: ribulose-phosphate 3-epimerase [Candidatus Caldatribacteriota bacterium]|nr:ribulose-phosphate 3-epimerase [Candidatus Caldatribacteriota bacterium]
MLRRKIAPSILDANFLKLGEQIDEINEGGADLIHLDIMDGCFVPNISFGVKVVESIKKRTSIPLDVHLMIENPEKHIRSFIKAGGDIITIHAEAGKHLDRLVQYIKESGVKCGLALNPATSLSAVEYLISKIDKLLVMTVNPGYGGQKFIPEMLVKMRKAKKMMEDNNRFIDLEVDGGINFENVCEVISSGANIIVAGSLIFKNKSPKNTIKKMKNIIKNC